MVFDIKVGKYLEPAAYILLFLPLLGMSVNWAIAGYSIAAIIGLLGILKVAKVVK